jgi:hypothetical protein
MNPFYGNDKKHPHESSRTGMTGLAIDGQKARSNQRGFQMGDK